jgi:uncharacterized small protein (DUF1192 family)
MKALGLVFCALFSVFASGQTFSPAPLQAPASDASTTQPASYANYSIMLANPAPGGGAVVLMHNPKNAIEFVPVNSTKQAFDAEYVAVRAGELDALIGALRDENARLSAEVDRLHAQAPAAQVVAIAPAAPSQGEIAERQSEAMETERAVRRQQLIQAWSMLNASRPQTFNVNVTSCTRSPALCVGR